MSNKILIPLSLISAALLVLSTQGEANVLRKMPYDEQAGLASAVITATANGSTECAYKGIPRRCVRLTDISVLKGNMPLGRDREVYVIIETFVAETSFKISKKRKRYLVFIREYDGYYWPVNGIYSLVVITELPGIAVTVH